MTNISSFMSVKSSIQFFVIFLSPLRKKKYFHFVGWIDAYVNKITQDFLNRMDVHEMFCEWQIRFFWVIAFGSVFCIYRNIISSSPLSSWLVQYLPRSLGLFSDFSIVYISLTLRTETFLGGSMHSNKCPSSIMAVLTLLVVFIGSNVILVL